MKHIGGLLRRIGRFIDYAMIYSVIVTGFVLTVVSLVSFVFGLLSGGESGLSLMIVGMALYILGTFARITRRRAALDDALARSFPDLSQTMRYFRLTMSREAQSRETYKEDDGVSDLHDNLRAHHADERSRVSDHLG